MAEISAKRSLQTNIDDCVSSPKRVKSDTSNTPLTPSVVCEPASSVSVDGLLVNVSPIKNRRFVAEIVDEKASISLVGFDPANQAKLAELSKNKSAIALTNCDVQYNRYSKRLEIVVKRHTLIQPSSREFKVTDTDNIGSTTITLSQLRDIQENDKVNVRIKVIDLKTPQKVGKNKTKQSVTVADNTNNCTLTLWEQDIDSLKLNQSYYITKLNVRIFQGDYTLSLPSSGSTTTDIKDIGDVVQALSDPMEPSMQGVSIIAVKELTHFKTCLSCKSKITVTDDDSDLFATCEKCNTTQRSNKSPTKIIAKLLIEGPDVSIITLVAYEDMLNHITVDDDQLTIENLLRASPFDVTYNGFHVITSVCRHS